MKPARSTAAQKTRQSVQDCALRLFAGRGYSAVSMRDIADAVGIQPGAIYNHFASKQQLLVALMTGHMRTLLTALDHAMADSDNCVQRLQTFAAFHLAYHIDHPDDVFLAYMELRSLEPDGYETVRKMRNQYERVLRNILSEGMKQNDFHIGDPDVHARAILSMLTGITVWYRDGGRLSRQQVISSYTQAAMQSTGIATAPINKRKSATRRER